MSDILVTSPYRPFTLPNQFKAVFNGYIYCGTVDAVDPSVSQVQVYLANEDGSSTPVAQPLRTNAGGFLVYNGQPAKFVTDSNHSLLVRDSLGNQLWYEPNMASVDPDAVIELIESKLSQSPPFNGDEYGDAMIAVKQPASGSIKTTQHDVNLLNVNLSQFAGGLPSSDDVSPALANAMSWLSLLGGGVLNVTKPGVYKMLSEVSIPENVTLHSARGVRFKRMFAGGVMFSLLENANDVSVIGGIFDSNGQEYPEVAADIFAAYNVKRLTFISATFIDVVDFHAIDLARTEDVLISCCKFLGFKDNGGRNFSEAIQLDPGFISSGGTYYPNKRITVECCYFGPNPDNLALGFTSWGAGIGNHADAIGNQSEDIVVRNSVFVGCLFGGVRVFNWNGYLVDGNTFKNSTARGVHITPVPDATAPQGSKHGRVTDNTFIGIRTPVLVAAPTWPFTDAANAFHQHLTISNNTAVLTEDVSAAFDLSWIDGLTMVGNTVRGGRALASFNFVRNYYVGGNTGVDFTGTGLWFKEITATTFIGTGLSSGAVVSGNTIRNTGQHGIHVNCALNGANISSNIIIGTATEDVTYNGIRADSAAKNIFIENNNHLDGGATLKPQLGISVTSSCEAVHVINNKSFGTVAPQNNQGINGSSLVMAGGVGAPLSAGVGAPPGSMYLRSDGGALTSLYIKETGTSSVGWVAK